MTESSAEGLFDLQKLDLRIKDAHGRLNEFEPRLEELEEPVESLAKDVDQLRARVQELKQDERRLASAAQEKRDRLAKLDERMTAVRNMREQAAVTAEIDLVRRALEADEQESFQVIDLIGRASDRLEEMEEELAEARTELAPRRQELLDQQKAVEAEIEELGAEREGLAGRVAPAERVLYERIQSGGRAISVAAMTEDGACGHCFAMVPLQIRNEIRAGRRMVCCESCGVILAAPLPEPDPADVAAEAEAEPDDPELEASADDATEGDAASDEEAEAEADAAPAEA